MVVTEYGKFNLAKALRDSEFYTRPTTELLESELVHPDIEYNNQDVSMLRKIHGRGLRNGPEDK